MIRILGAILLCALPASAANIRGRTAAPVAGPTPALALPEVSPPATLDAALAAPGSPLATAPQPSALELAAAPLAEPTAAIAPAPQTALAHLPYQAPPSPAPGASAPSREEAQAERLPPATKTLRALADPKASASRPAEARLSATYDGGLLDGEHIIVLPSYYYGKQSGVTTFIDQWAASLLSRNSATLHLLQPTNAPYARTETRKFGAGELRSVPARYTGLASDFAAWEGPLRERLAKLVAEVRPGLIMLQTPLENIARMAAEAAAPSGAATMVLAHTLSPQMSQPAAVAAHGALDARAAVSHALAGKLAPDTAVLSPVLDLDFWRAGAVSDLTRRTLRARNGLSNRFVLLAPHRFMPTKGQLDALEALRVLNASGHRFALILAGEISGKEQPYAERLRAYIREHGLSGDVIWLPPQDRIEMREWYAASDAVLVPTTNEALGLVALEAQAMGVPVAGYRAMGIPETVEDGVTGLLSEPGDFAGLAANVARMESDAEFYAQARTRAPRFVREAYDPTAVAAQHEAFYRGLIDRARRR